MTHTNFTYTTTVQRFPGKGGWWFIRVPDDVARQIVSHRDRMTGFRFVPIIVQIGGHRWNTSLLPLGRDAYFVPIKRQARKHIGDMMLDETVQVSLSVGRMSS